MNNATTNKVTETTAQAISRLTLVIEFDDGFIVRRPSVYPMRNSLALPFARRMYDKFGCEYAVTTDGDVVSQAVRE